MTRKEHWDLRQKGLCVDCGQPAMLEPLQYLGRVRPSDTQNYKGKTIEHLNHQPRCEPCYNAPVCTACVKSFKPTRRRKALQGKKLCRYHIDQAATRRADRHSNTLCVQCGQHNDSTFQRCQVCRTADATRRADRHANTLCVQCGQHNDSTFQRCQVCRTADATRRADRHAYTLCVRCGQHNDSTFQECQKCRDRRRELAQARKQAA